MQSTLDLHMHSNHSLDGKLDINIILDKCAEKGIKVVSITDHDSCDVYLDINKTNFEGTIIYGMEADALVGKLTYDILCYDFDLEPVRKWAHSQYGTLESRQKKIFEKLCEICNKLDLKLDDSTPYQDQTEYAHAALFRMLENIPESKQFLDNLNIKTVTDLYREGTTSESFPLYIDMHLVWPTIEDVQKIIHQNGGKIFLAHPFKYGKETDVEDILNSCLPYIDGIEICNESNQEQVQFLYDFAHKHNLLISAGNDFHGSEKHSELGVTNITKDMEDEIYNWVNKAKHKILIKKTEMK